MDTSKKENDLADMQEHIAALSENVNEQISDINKAMKEDPDKEDDQEITDIDEQENSEEEGGQYVDNKRISVK